LEAEAHGFRDTSSRQSRIDKLEEEIKGKVPLSDEGDMETILVVEVLGKAEKNNLRPVKYAVSDAGQVKKKDEAVLYKKKYYDVTLEGDYPDLLRFLKEVSYLPHMLTVEKLEIESKDGRLEITLLLGMG
jgi:Tfp pilus assembly protein PilO